jgi:hypothetical protein
MHAKRSRPQGCLRPACGGAPPLHESPHITSQRDSGRRLDLDARTTLKTVADLVLRCTCPCLFPMNAPPPVFRSAGAVHVRHPAPLQLLL